MIGIREMNLDQLAVDHQIDVNPLTGAAQLSVPVRITPGRESFNPSLSLGYSSGQKNSTFGVGWFLSGVPSIGIDTTKSHSRKLIWRMPLPSLPKTMTSRSGYLFS